MIALPPWLDPDAWLGFCEMRKKTRKPMTERAERLILAKLNEIRDRGHSPNDALDTSTVNCWAGVFEPKAVANGQHYPEHKQSTWLTEQANHRREVEAQRLLRKARGA